MQTLHNEKQGLGYVAKKKKKKNAKPAQAKKNVIASGDAIRGETSRSNSSGTNNPHYILFEDYYGVVYDEYVGPNFDFIDYFIWVPNTLVANVRGPIGRWGPKPKP